MRQLAVMTRFEDGLRCHQDWDFCLRLEHRGARFAFLAEPLAIWQNEDRSDRLSRSFDPRYSAHWLERARDSLSDRAYLARSAYLAPLNDDNRRSALAKVLVALRSLVVSPVAYTLNALERPDILLVWNGVRFVAVLGALIGVPALGGTPVQAVTAYSPTLAATYAALYVICLWQISVRGPEREAPPPWSDSSKTKTTPTMK